MRVLIVDDDTGLIQLLRLVFESRGFAVTVAFNGAQALDTLKKELPQVILMDMMMPDMNGLEVCNKIRVNPRTSHIPIIMLTARAGEEMRHEALKAGATKYLVKPIRPSELITHISQAASHPISPAKQVLT